MPNNSNDISNDELIMDDDIQPRKTNMDNIFQQFSSNHTNKKDRKPVIPFFLGFLGSLALSVGLCFLSAWCAFCFIAPMMLFIFAISNNNHNNRKKAEEWMQQNNTNQLDTPTPTPDLVVENAINNQKTPIDNNIKIPEKEETPIGKQNTSETKEDEKTFMQNFNANFKNSQDTKSNVETKTNLDTINKINKDRKIMEK